MKNASILFCVIALPVCVFGMEHTTEVQVIVGEKTFSVPKSTFDQFSFFTNLTESLPNDPNSPESNEIYAPAMISPDAFAHVLAVAEESCSACKTPADEIAHLEAIDALGCSADAFKNAGRRFVEKVVTPADQKSATEILALLANSRIDYPLGQCSKIKNQLYEAFMVGMLSNPSLVKKCSQNRYVLSVACSPDGIQLASGSTDKAVRLWNIETGELKRIFNGTSFPNTVSYSSDGKFVASANLDHIVHVWDTENGEEMQPFEYGHEGERKVTFSSDGQWFAAGGFNNLIHVWDLKNRKKVCDFKCTNQALSLVAFGTDRKILASGSNDGMVRLWNIEAKSEICVLHAPEIIGKTIDAVALSPDGKQVAGGSWDNCAFVWNVGTKQLVHTFKHDGGVTSVFFTSDSKYLVTGSDDKAVRLWDTKTKKCIYTLSYGGKVSSVTCSRSDKHLCVAVEGIHIYPLPGADVATELKKMALSQQLLLLYGHNNLIDLKKLAMNFEKEVEEDEKEFSLERLYASIPSTVKKAVKQGFK